jgi:tRNA uridine 5-carbamoylmethylation protein Kti12
MKATNNLGYYLIIRGPLGCGKSTISKELAKELNAEYIAVDRVLDEHNLTNDWEDGYISQKSFLKVNEIVSERAKKLLNKNKPVIFDGNFYWKSCIDDLISRLNYPHYVFTLKAPVETCINRDEERGKTHGEDAARAVYKKSTSFEYGIPIETKGKSVEETLVSIRRKLK